MTCLFIVTYVLHCLNVTTHRNKGLCLRLLSKDFVTVTAFSRMTEGADPSLSLSGGFRPKALHSDLLETPARRRIHRPQDCAVIVAWLERFEDRLQFPIAELTASLHSPVSASSGYYSLTKRGLDSTLPVVFIHPLSSGLYRISTHLASSR